jgi:hypothetical protein
LGLLAVHHVFDNFFGTSFGNTALILIFSHKFAGQARTNTNTTVSTEKLLRAIEVPSKYKICTAFIWKLSPQDDDDK